MYFFGYTEYQSCLHSYYSSGSPMVTQHSTFLEVQYLFLVLLCWLCYLINVSCKRSILKMIRFVSVLSKIESDFGFSLPPLFKIFLSTFQLGKNNVLKTEKYLHPRLSDYCIFFRLCYFTINFFMHFNCIS